MTTEPDTKTHKMIGKYSSEAAAKAAMATMKRQRGVLPMLSAAVRRVV
jgi:hypothetical protein